MTSLDWELRANCYCVIAGAVGVGYNCCGTPGDGNSWRTGTGPFLFFLGLGFVSIVVAGRREALRDGKRMTGDSGGRSDNLISLMGWKVSRRTAVAGVLGLAVGIGAVGVMLGRCVRDWASGLPWALEGTMVLQVLCIMFVALSYVGHKLSAPVPE